jgi:hypothetical protein
MDRPRQVADLDTPQDLRAQRIDWRFERAGWVAIALVLLAAIAGLLGPGLLSEATAGSTGTALWAEYNRFERYQAPAQLRLHARPAGASDTLQVWLDRAYLESFEIERVDPPPRAVAVGPDRLIYEFALAPGSGPVSVTFHVQAIDYWRVPVRLGVVGGPELAFTQLVYP